VIVDEPARWDAQAERYDSSYDDPRAGRLVRARLETALELLGDGPGQVLDAGTGGGRLLEALAARGWSVTGADVSEAMIELARRRVPDAKLVVAPVEHLPFGEGSFDAVAALGVLEFAQDLDAALAELARVLRPGGPAVVSWPNFGGVYTAWRGGVVYRVARALGRPAPPPARHVLDAGQLRAQLGRAGLTPSVEILLGPSGARLRAGLGPLAAQRVSSARKRT
jgi:2-polyprenyl-3-methyl-5-hydroxy-6-metoxy-1,4-benzoquinol methylase